MRTAPLKYGHTYDQDTVLYPRWIEWGIRLRILTRYLGHSCFPVQGGEPDMFQVHVRQPLRA